MLLNSLTPPKYTVWSGVGGLRKGDVDTKIITKLHFLSYQHSKGQPMTMEGLQNITKNIIP